MLTTVNKARCVLHKVFYHKQIRTLQTGIKNYQGAKWCNLGSKLYLMTFQVYY